MKPTAKLNLPSRKQANFLCLIAFFICNHVVAQNLTSNLVICMPMNGNALDASGNNNNGILTGAAPAADRFGTPNSALYFSGNPSKIIVPASSSINNIETQSELTIAVWCKITSFGATNCFPVANKYNATSNWGWDYTIQPPATHNGQILVPNFQTMGGNYAICKGNEGVTLNQWDFYAITFSKSTSTFRVYKNSTLLNTVNTGTYQLEATGNGSLYIGCSPAANMDYAEGFIDDFKMYSRALTPQEIQALYNGSGACCVAVASPSAIAGNTLVCIGAQSSYSIAPVSGATSYSWTASGAGLSGTPNGNSITIVGNTLGNASITVVASNSCSTSPPSTLTLRVSECGTTGIPEETAEKIMIYPNPNQGAFTVITEEKCSITLTDLTGRIVHSAVLEGRNLKISSSLSKGIYHANLYNESGTLIYSDKIIIE
jgi:hypothetical protein